MLAMKRSIVSLATGALLLSAAGAQAMEGSVGLHFADYDDFDSGAGIHGHLDVMPEVRLSGQYTSTDFLDRLRFSGGYVLQMNELEMEFGASYQFWDFEGPAEDDVYGAHGIISYSVMDELSLRGKLEYIAFDILDQDTLVIGLGASYDITPEFSVGLDLEIFEDDAFDQTFLQLGASYNFNF